MTKRKKEMISKMIQKYTGYEPKIKLTAKIYRTVMFYGEIRITTGEAVLTKENNKEYSIYEHYKNNREVMLYATYNNYEEAREKFLKLYY